MYEIIVHKRVRERHRELEDRDVQHAWYNCLRSAPRIDSPLDTYVAVGQDGKGRLIEIVAVRLAGNTWLIYHAMAPPSKKTLRELGFA